MNVRFPGWLLVAGWLTGLACVEAQAPPLSESTVGMPQRIEQLVLPGSLLQVRPLEDRHQPLVLRVIESYRHGSGHRYDLEYYALEPGIYNLTDYLQRADGSVADDLPVVTVRVDSTLPSGQIVPSPLNDVNIGWIGGYRWILGLGAGVWLTGLAALVFLGRRRATEPPDAPPAGESLTSRLERLLAEARDRKLTPERGAELERSVIAFWRQELGLEQTASAELLQAIRSDPQAAVMLDELGRWLHQPNQGGDVDWDQLLKPIAERIGERSRSPGTESTSDPGLSSRDQVSAR